MNENCKVILRWIALPFASVIGSMIAYAFIMLWVKGNSFGFSLYNGNEVGNIIDIILAIVAQSMFGYVFVYIGSITAPKYKKTCSIVLATIMCILVTTSFVISCVINGFYFLQLLHNCATAIGAIMASNLILKNEIDVKNI